MLRRSSTTGLMAEASRKVHATIGVFLFTDVVVLHDEEALMELNTASWSTIAANYRSELVIVPPGLVKLTSFRTMSSGHFTFQYRLHLF